MPKFEITPSCHEAVLANATPGREFEDTTVLLPNGNRMVRVSVPTYRRLLEIKFPGESLSDAVERLCRAVGRRLN